MTVPLDALRDHAAACAKYELCTTIDLTARALNCSPAAAQAGLKFVAEAGYFRWLLTPGLGNTICYQPTPKAAGLSGAAAMHPPKFLRAGLAPAARMRGLLRGFVALAARPDDPKFKYLAVSSNRELCTQYGLREAGRARALIAFDPTVGRYQIFVPVIKTDNPLAVVEASASRWLPALATCADLHFVAPAGPVADGLRSVLDSLKPATAGDSAALELARIESEIRSDSTGLKALQLAGRQMELKLEIEAGHGVSFNWLGGVVEAVL